MFLFFTITQHLLVKFYVNFMQQRYNKNDPDPSLAHISEQMMLLKCTFKDFILFGCNCIKLKGKVLKIKAQAYNREVLIIMQSIFSQQSHLQNLIKILKYDIFV